MVSSLFKKLLENVCFGFTLPSELLLFNINFFFFLLLVAAAGFSHDLFAALLFLYPASAVLKPWSWLTLQASGKV